MKVSTNPSRAKCWKCARACGGMDCPWIDNSQHVDGWEVTTREIKQYDGKNQYKQTTQVIVEDCPLFVKDGEIEIIRPKPYLTEHSPTTCHVQLNSHKSKNR